MPPELCKAAKPMRNGQVTYEGGDTTIGSTTLYTCMEGYSLTGNRRRTCLQHGSWSGMEPICESKIFDESRAITPN